MWRYNNVPDSPGCVFLIIIVVCGIWGLYNFSEFGLFAPILGIGVMFGVYYLFKLINEREDERDYKSKFIDGIAHFTDMEHRRIQIHKDKIIHSNLVISANDICIITKYTGSKSEICIEYWDKTYKFSMTKRLYIPLSSNEVDLFIRATKELGVHK